MDETIFWLLVASSTVLTAGLLVKYVGRLGALAIMVAALLAAWILGFSVGGFSKSVREMILGLIQTLINLLS